MTVRVRFFAIARDAAGGIDAADLPVDGSPDVAGVVRALVERYPGLASIEPRLAVAVNLEYVDRTHLVSEGDEIALIPPVSGG